MPDPYVVVLTFDRDDETVDVLIDYLKELAAEQRFSDPSVGIFPDEALAAALDSAAAQILNHRCSYTKGPSCASQEPSPPGSATKH